MAFVDKAAGLVRPIPDKRNKDKVVVLPVACNVTDPLACDDTQIRDLLPDPKYRSVMYFEAHSMPSKVMDRVIGTKYECRLRLVVWVNCEKLGGSCDCGDIAQLQLLDVLNRRIPDASPFRHVVVSAVGGGPVGKEIFARYTFDEPTTQYLHYPYDAFAIDVIVGFRLFPGCSEAMIADDTACWTAPVQPRRRYPREFSIDELQDPVNGLTDQQRTALCS